MAAVDLGSNSFHLIVARQDGGHRQVIDKLREMVRLAAGLDNEKNLSEEAQSRALHGLYRALCQGMVEGVEKGFSKTLDVVGVSYQASIEGGTKVRLQVGFSHPVILEIPKGLSVECPTPTRIVVSGCDKQLVGEFAARQRP